MKNRTFYIFIIFVLFILGCQTPMEKHNQKGIAYVRSGELTRAKKEFRKAIEIDPEYAPAHNNLGFLLYRESIARRTPADSYLHLTNVQKQSPSDAILVNKALSHLQAALKYTAEDKIIRQIRENLALLYTDTGIGADVREPDWFKKGIEIYEILIQEEPNNPELHMRLGFAYFNVANPGGGFSELEKSSKLAQDRDTLWIHEEIERFYWRINFVSKAREERKIIEALSKETD